MGWEFEPIIGEVVWVDEPTPTPEETPTTPTTDQGGGRYRNIVLDDGRVVTEEWVPGFTDKDSNYWPGQWQRVGSPYREPTSGGGAAADVPVQVVSVDSTSYPGYDVTTWSDGNQTMRESPQAAQPVQPVSGTLVPTEVPGVYMNPNTGVTVDTRISPTEQPTVYDPGSIPTGYVGIRDAAGNIVDIVSDPTYARPSEDPTYYDPALIPEGYVGVTDTEGNIVDIVAEVEATKYAQTVTPVTGMPGLWEARDADGNIIQTGGSYDPLAQDKFNEEVRQFDVTNATRIKDINASIERVRIQEAGANARQAASLKAQRANLELELKRSEER